MRLLLLAGIASIVAVVRAAQPPTAPAAAQGGSREVVAVFISMGSCCDALVDSLRAPIETLKARFKVQAARERSTFRSVGVALDWEPDEGWNHLKRFGRFDEIAVGSNWYGLTAESLIWMDSTVAPAVPQLLVYEHDVTGEANRVRFGKRRVLKSARGPVEIRRWAITCAQTPAASCY